LKLGDQQASGNVQKHDKTIYLAYIGWVLLDAAGVIGVVVHR
jgi:hypothetical protein